MIDLKELEQKLKEALAKETPESLRKWLDEKRREEKLADEQSEVRVELPVILQGELLPCPFCGNKKVKIIEYEALGMWRCVQCDKCKGQFYFFNKGTNIGVGRGTTQQRKERIIEAWNKRAGREPQTK